MIAVRTQFDKAKLTRRADKGRRGLGALRESIEHAVPLSAGKYNRELTDTAAKRCEELSAKAAEDGWVLTSCLADATSVPEALQQWQSTQRELGTSLLDRTRTIGRRPPIGRASGRGRG